MAQNDFEFLGSLRKTRKMGEKPQNQESVETLKIKVAKLESEKMNNLKTMHEDFGVSPQMISSLEKKKAQLKKAMELLELEANYHDQIEDYQEKINQAKIGVYKVRKMNGYKTKDEIHSIKADIAEMKKRKFVQIDECAICLEMPDKNVKIFSCQRCGGLFCRPCVFSLRDGRFKVDKCPLCQVSINEEPFIRNMFVEKCLRN